METSDAEESIQCGVQGESGAGSAGGRKTANEIAGAYEVHPVVFLTWIRISIQYLQDIDYKVT